MGIHTHFIWYTLYSHQEIEHQRMLLPTNKHIFGHVTLSDIFKEYGNSQSTESEVALEKQ